MKSVISIGDTYFHHMASLVLSILDLTENVQTLNVAKLGFLESLICNECKILNSAFQVLPRESDGELSKQDEKRMLFQRKLIAKVMEARVALAEAHGMIINYVSMKPTPVC